MAVSGKWIEGIDAAAPVEEAARKSLEPRLSAVAGSLPLAAHLAEHDVEYVHRLRVATRRAGAALKLYKELLPRKPARWLKKRLRKIRQAAGDARDLDVLAHRLNAQYGEKAAAILNLIREERAAVQDTVAEIAARCSHKDRYVRETAKLISGIRSPHSENGKSQTQRTFGQWARTRLTKLAAKFFDALPSESSNLASLHEFRIRAKALRYAIELVASAYSAELRRSAYPLVESLQERLGEIQDLVAARCRFEDWAASGSHASLRPLLPELVQADGERLTKCLQEFQIWWNEERANTLRELLLPPDSRHLAESRNGGAATTESNHQSDLQTQRAP